MIEEEREHVFMESYRYLAGIYDSCMYDVDYAAWYSYIKSLLDAHEVSGDVIETACGTGNITQFLAKDYEVIAVDSSEEMLSVAREKLKSRGLDAVFACSDMADFEREKGCLAVVCAMDGVNYLTNGPDAFFRAAYGNLKPGGVLLFDISSEYKLKETIGDGMFCDVSDDASYIWMNEFKSGILTMDITLFIKNDRGSYDRFDEIHEQRAYSTEEITESLEKAGFKDIKAYGFMTTDEPEADAGRIQFAAVREQ